MNKLKIGVKKIWNFQLLKNNIILKIQNTHLEKVCVHHINKGKELVSDNENVLQPKRVGGY